MAIKLSTEPPKDEDYCPACKKPHLIGYHDSYLITCMNCAWAIRKQAWLEAWQ